MGLPYVLSSDLVSGYPAKSLAIATYVDDLIPLLAMTQNAQTGVTYSFVLTDFTKLVTLSNASAVAVTLPLEATVAWPTGTQLRLLNVGAGTVTVAGAVGVTINGTPLTLAQYKGANIIKTGTNTWVFIPFASGAGAADFSNTATGTYSGFKYLTFSSSGTITISTAGFADLVIVGGGGRGGTGIGLSGAGGGGGAGGFANLSQVYLPAGTLTVTVGGATGPSRIGSYVSPQGGSGGRGGGSGQADWGGCGGGGGGGAANAGGTALVSFGFDGGTTSGGTGGASGGGGAGVVGVNSASSANGGAGGAGSSTTIAGTTPTGAYVAGSFSFGGGGGGGAYSGGSAGAAGSVGGAAGSASGNGNAAAANLGGGGGGAFGSNSSGTNYSGGLGGSGFIIVRVAV